MILAGVCSMLFLWLGGSCIARFLKLNMVAESGLAIGSLLAIVVLFVGGMVGLSLSVCALMLMVVLLSAIGYSMFFTSMLKNCREGVELRSLGRFLIPAVVATLLCWYGFSFPLDNMPGVELHGLKTKLFLANDGIGMWFYEGESWSLVRNHYPPGFALLSTGCAKIMGGFDPVEIRVVSLFYLCALLWLVQKTSYRYTKGAVAWVLPSMLFLSPQMVDLSRYFYAEPCMLYLGFVGCLLIGKKRFKEMFVGVVALIGMGWMKNEGLVQGAIVAAVVMLFSWKQLGTRKILGLSLGGIVILPWAACLVGFQLGERSFDWSRVIGVFENVDFHLNTLKVLSDEMFFGNEIYSGVWWVLVGAILLRTTFAIWDKKRWNWSEWDSTMQFIGCLSLWAIFLILVFQCSLDPDDHALAAWRLLMLPTLAAIIGVMKLLKDNREYEENV